MSVVRAWNWEKRLHHFVATTQPIALALGEQDCALWALRAVDAMCDTTLAEPFRGTYSTLPEAVALFAAQGWGSVEEAAVALVGPRLPTVALARRGDLLVLPPTEAEPVGIAFILGDGGFWGAGYEGVTFTPARVMRVLPLVGIRCG